MEQSGFRFTRKEIAVLVIGTALALGSFHADDPVVVIPMLIVSWAAFLYICAVHEGPSGWRWISAAAITLVLVAIGGRLFWLFVHEELKDMSAWLSGSHGRWFDRFTGAISLILIATIAKLIRNAMIQGRLIRRASLSRIDGAPKGFMDHKLDVEQALTAMPAILGKLGRIIGEVGPMLEKRTVALQRASSTVKQAKIFAATSSSLNQYSSRVESIRIKFTATGGMLSSGLVGWFKWIESTRPHKAAMGVFPDSMATFRGIIDTSNVQTRAYIDILRSAKGASRVLDIALDRHIVLMEEILAIDITISEACGEALRVFNGLS